jgi:VIT1/CCC1 family predicted Fe2+/Mn2+ transporter
MATRLKFAVLAGVAGIFLGLVAATVLKKNAEAFPTHIVVACAATFAVGGAIAKRQWAQEVIGFFVSRFL